MTRPLRVLAVDDHPVYRDGLRVALDGWPEAQLVGEASTGGEAVEAAARLRPDVVLMDLQMPGGSGIEATRAIVARAPATAVLVLTMFDDDASVAAALRAGARGYLLKGASRDELRRAIATVGGGAAVLASGVADQLTSFFRGERPAAVRPFPELTERERAVLELVAQGRDNASIAALLGISDKTVRNYLSLVFDKLAVAGRAEAIVRAREAGMGGETPRSRSPRA